MTDPAPAPLEHLHLSPSNYTIGHYTDNPPVDVTTTGV